MSRSAALALALALTGCGSASSASSTSSATSTNAGGGTTTGGSPKTPSRDSFHGSVIGGTGRYAGAHGAFSVALAVAPGGTVRLMKARIDGALCRSGCRKLRLDISGTFIAKRAAHPDVGPTFALRGTGRTVVVGPFTATGSGHGTGFIRGGHATLRLTVRAGHGTFLIDATSAPLPPFTIP